MYKENNRKYCKSRRTAIELDIKLNCSIIKIIADYSLFQYLLKQTVLVYSSRFRILYDGYISSSRSNDCSFDHRLTVICSPPHHPILIQKYTQNTDPIHYTLQFNAHSIINHPNRPTTTDFAILVLKSKLYPLLSRNYYIT